MLWKIVGSHNVNINGFKPDLFLQCAQWIFVRMCACLCVCVLGG